MFSATEIILAALQRRDWKIGGRGRRLGNYVTQSRNEENGTKGSNFKDEAKTLD